MVSHCFNLHLPDGNQCGTTFLVLVVIYIFSLMLCLIVQLCLTLCDPMDCSPPGPYVHDILQEILDCHVLLQVTFPTQGLKTGLLHCRQILYHLSQQGGPFLWYVCESLWPTS